MVFYRLSISLFHSFSNKFLLKFYSPKQGVKTEKIRKGRILGGVQGYLNGIFRDPSLTKFQKKRREIVENSRNTECKTN